MSTDSPDPQDLAEALDSDMVDASSDTIGTPDDADLDYPPDRLLGADEFGTTSAEEQFGEPLDERVSREQPDSLVQELEHADEVLERDADGTTIRAALDDLELQLDEEALAAIDLIEPMQMEDPLLAEDADTGEAGRLMEPGVGDDVTGLDDEAEAVARAFDEGDLSAEESAVHLTEDPPMGRQGGDYV